MDVIFTVPVDVLVSGGTGKDTYGNAAPTFTSAGVVEGIFAPGGSTEQVNGRDMVVDQPTVYLPLPAPAAVDRVTVNGQTFEVDGAPAVWPANPFTGWQPDFPVVVRLRGVTG